MLARLDTLAGLRAWRDFLVPHQRELNCRGGCPIGSLGSELAETDSRPGRPSRPGSAARRTGSAAATRPCTTGASWRRGPSWPARHRHGGRASGRGLLLTQIRRGTEPLEAALDTRLAHVASLLVG
jgi:hypothetical protein